MDKNNLNLKTYLPSYESTMEMLEDYREDILRKRGYHPIIEYIDTCIASHQVLIHKFLEMKDDLDQRKYTIAELRAFMKEFQTLLDAELAKISSE